MLTGHPKIERLWSEAGVYDLSGRPDLNLSSKASSMMVHSGGVELWDLFRGQVRSAAAVETESSSGMTDVDSRSGELNTPEKPSGNDVVLSSGEDTELDPECETCPTRMFSYVSNKKGHRTTGSLIGQVLSRAQSLGAFVSVTVNENIMSWYYDPGSGSAVSQMTPREIEKCGTTMSLVSKDRVHFILL